MVQEEDQFFRILAACIHLGDVEFAGDEGHVSLAPGPALRNAATLLDVPADRLESALLGINTITRGETIRRLYTRAQAGDCKDALIKVCALLLVAFFFDAKRDALVLACIR